MEIIDHLLGLHDSDLNWYQMSLRAVIVFFVALFNIFIAGRHAFKKRSTSELVFSLILGAVLGKAVVGEAPFFPIIIASLALTFLQKITGIIQYRIRMNNPCKPLPLIRDGKLIEENMAKVRITKCQLETSARYEGSVNELSKVKEAWFEEDGRISIITYN